MGQQERSTISNSRKEWEKLAGKVLAAARQELYLSMRYLYLALNKLTPVADGRVRRMGTDGRVLAFQPMQVAELYRQDGVAVSRAYLHSVLHALFSHMYRRGEREEWRWNLACDIAVEEIIDSLESRAVRRVVPDRCEQLYAWLSGKCRVHSAERIYEALEAREREAPSPAPGEWSPAELEALFWVDDHCFWPCGDGQQGQPQEREAGEQERELWRELREQMQTEMETYSRAAGMGKSRIYQEIAYENREKTSYREFLRRFAAPTEVLRLDPDSFDFGYYQYGMQLYGNMPLIEELEYREENRIGEFAVVLDTSGSCSREMVARFLAETVSVLSEAESFRDGFVCHILQCDNQIQEEAEVRSAAELERYLQEFRVCGRGGTDFRPAFLHMDQALASGRWGRLDGVLYFTDGYGIYPERCPAYDTAFLFVEEEWAEGRPPWRAEGFPVWAMHLELPAETR